MSGAGSLLATRPIHFPYSSLPWARDSAIEDELAGGTTERDDSRSTFGEQAEDGWGLSISLGYLGLLAGERGEHAYAAAVHRESLQLRWDAGVWEDVAASLADLAALAMKTGRAEQAARLFGAAAAVREETGRPLVSHYPERDVFERAEAKARMALGAEGFAAAEARGRAMPREEAIDEALALAGKIVRAGPHADTHAG